MQGWISHGAAGGQAVRGVVEGFHVLSSRATRGICSPLAEPRCRFLRCCCWHGFLVTRTNCRSLYSMLALVARDDTQKEERTCTARLAPSRDDKEKWMRHATRLQQPLKACSTLPSPSIPHIWKSRMCGPPGVDLLNANSRRQWWKHSTAYAPARYRSQSGCSQRYHRSTGGTETEALQGRKT